MSSLGSNVSAIDAANHSSVPEYRHYIQIYTKQFDVDGQSHRGAMYWFPCERIIGLWIFKGGFLYESELRSRDCQVFLCDCPDTSLEIKWLSVLENNEINVESVTEELVTLEYSACKHYLNRINEAALIAKRYRKIMSFIEKDKDELLTMADHFRGKKTKYSEVNPASTKQTYGRRV